MEEVNALASQNCDCVFDFRKKNKKIHEITRLYTQTDHKGGSTSAGVHSEKIYATGGIHPSGISALSEYTAS